MRVCADWSDQFIGKVSEEMVAPFLEQMVLNILNVNTLYKHNDKTARKKQKYSKERKALLYSLLYKLNYFKIQRRNSSIN